MQVKPARHIKESVGVVNGNIPFLTPGAKLGRAMTVRATTQKG